MYKDKSSTKSTNTKVKTKKKKYIELEKNSKKYYLGIDRIREMKSLKKKHALL